MDYAICDGESLEVWVEVSALYKRSFLVAQGDPISIGPGTVFLTASLTEAGHSALLHEDYFDGDGLDDLEEEDEEEEDEEEDEEEEDLGAGGGGGEQDAGNGYGSSIGLEVRLG